MITIHPPSFFIIQSLQLLQIDFLLLGEDEAEFVRKQVIRKYTSTSGPVIWENLLHDASIQNPDGWRLIDEYVSGTSFLLFFDEDEDRSMIELAAGSNLTSVLEECSGFEFYITDHETTYV